MRRACGFCMGWDRMNTEICIYEDEHCVDLFPLALTRPVYELRCGVTSLREKIVRQYPEAKLCLHCRDYLEGVVEEENPGLDVNRVTADGCLFINGRVLAGSGLSRLVPILGEDCLYLKGDTVVAARVSGPALEELKANLSQPLTRDRLRIEKAEAIDMELIRYPWDLMHRNSDWIRADFEVLVGTGSVSGRVYNGVTVVDDPRVYIGEGSRIKPGAVLDAEEGPIYIGQGVTVYPNATIEGPAFIGDGSTIKAGAKISGGTSIGEACKIGGEVEESIIHGYSNKQHDGFLGHSYLGMWINLGAGTNNSDLKNNYGNVRVYVNGELVDTGSLFVGLMMGDHSKSGINTMFNTGAVVGACCNVFGAGYPPKFIPSFCWGGSEGLRKHDLQKAIQTARTVMARRQVELTGEGERLLRRVFALTAMGRRAALG